MKFSLFLGLCAIFSIIQLGQSAAINPWQPVSPDTGVSDLNGCIKACYAVYGNRALGKWENNECSCKRKAINHDVDHLG